MQIFLHQLNQAKDGLLFVEDTIHLTLDEEVSGLEQLAPVDVKARVEMVDPHFFVAKGELSTTAVFSCAKCLSEFKQEIKASFEEHFTDDPHRAVESEEQEIHLADENKLDLTPFIREALLLQFPYIPVCREDCKGLCPECGKNRNTESCRCRVEKIDPRLAVLGDWFQNDA
ncbi:DUF177 domain-containing protein [Thermoactinomyces sp. CICC 10735]|uniref:YceD family protein n=1 Tax=Thermoactinomyces sp. CICC 10735 TaxID=2767430 RepID=UPI0018DC94D5|nr:DUF177 domain-containing protein [Thermoactinomyces sp. CICC 10735]MBH8582750.1 DUF177 domain-containing protein [Thermoactinomyces sp. CICC 10735]